MKMLLVAMAVIAFSPNAPASVDSADAQVDASIELACKPRGTSCHTSFECCSQKCLPSNGVDTCH
jgi:hypothetical protein